VCRARATPAEPKKVITRSESGRGVSALRFAQEEGCAMRQRHILLASPSLQAGRLLSPPRPSTMTCDAGFAMDGFVQMLDFMDGEYLGRSLTLGSPGYEHQIQGVGLQG
jgi:hypothetical protein